MTRMVFDDKKITLHNLAGEVVIDLTQAVRAEMYNRSEVRYYTVCDFTLGNVYPLEGGNIRVELLNRKQGLFIPITFKPTADGFRVSVAAGEIVEQYGLNRKLMRLALLPDLMESTTSDDGFLVIPCFSGALVSLAQTESIVHRDRIYMEQKDWEKLNLMNCFALNRNGIGVLAVVHSGDFNCHVTAELAQAGMNRIFADFTLRTHEGMPIKQEVKEVVYAFAEGRNAEYPGMARRYGRYLTQERGVSPLKGRIAGNKVLAYSATAMRVKLFLGCKRPSLADGSGTFTPMASFKQAEEILDAMKAAGIDRAVVTLVGWNLGGHDGAYPTHFPVEPGLGGEADLRALIEKAKGMGYQIVPHDNFTDVYRSAPDYDAEFVVRTERGEPLVVGIWGGGQSFKACPVVYMDRYGHEVDRIQKLGFEGSYLCDAQSPVLWTCHDPRHPADEEQFAISLARMTQIPRNLYGAVSSEIASAFSLPFVDEVTSIHSVGNVEYLIENLCAPHLKQIIERIIPFYQIAVHGLLLYQQSWVHKLGAGDTLLKNQLRELAFGARPCMEVSYVKGGGGGYYLESIENLKEAYQRNFVELADIHVERIADYEEFSPEAVRLTYENGTVLDINWSENEVAGLPPLSVAIKKANVAS